METLAALRLGFPCIRAAVVTRGDSAECGTYIWISGLALSVGHEWQIQHADLDLDLSGPNLQGTAPRTASHLYI